MNPINTFANKVGAFSGILFAIALLASCTTMPVQLPPGVSPVQATWLYGRYTIPAYATGSMVSKTFQQTPGEPPWTQLAAKALKPNTSLPVVLYLHGCRGWSNQDAIYRDLLIAEGYAVFMPDSFQRPGRAACREQGPLRHRVKLRTEEVAYALNEIRHLTWVDQKRVLLMGFSEGGNTVDSWSMPGFAAQIIMGSACTLVDGIPAAPASVAVLAIVGQNDDYRPGQSCWVERTNGGSRSIVIPGGPHKVADYPQTREAIRTFLHQCCS